MLQSTQKLIAYFQLDASLRNTTLITSLVNAVVKCGDKQDAKALFKQYLKNTSEFHYSYLLPVFKAFADASMAAELFDIVIKDQQLIPNADPEILEVLGHLQFAPIKPILAEYLFNSDTKTDYYISKYAALGLLHFNCDEYQETILKAIEKCYGENLFPEFIPALVCKLKDTKKTLQKLYDLGDEVASTDCNAGILLGFSLCGEEGKYYFKKALFNQHWETFSTSTGTIHYAYEGLKNLGILLQELYQEIKSISDTASLSYAMDVFLALLNKKIEDIEHNATESYASLYVALFQWKSASESDNFIDLATSVDKETEAYEIEKLLALKMNEEVVLKNFI